MCALIANVGEGWPVEASRVGDGEVYSPTVSHRLSDSKNRMIFVLPNVM